MHRGVGNGDKYAAGKTVKKDLLDYYYCVTLGLSGVVNQPQDEGVCTYTLSKVCDSRPRSSQNDIYFPSVYFYGTHRLESQYC